VVGYRLPGGAKPNDYVRMEGRIPTRLETDNWYGPVPDTVEEAFLDAGILLDDPPFPIPPPPPRAPEPPPRASTTTAGAPRTPRVPRQRAAPAAKPEPAPTSRVCPSCRMVKSVSQFVAGSELCVDCR
jgi:hypothetical protein